MKIVLPISLNLIFWGLMGLLRWTTEKRNEKKQEVINMSVINKMTEKVAVLIPAHNEESTLCKTINSIKRLVSPNQIYVASDGSTDNTANLARQSGCHVLEITPGKGKAGALEALIKHYQILDNYQFVLFADADTTFNLNYLKRALPVFVKNEKVVAITPYGYSLQNGKGPFGFGTFLLAYRGRLWRILQRLLTYGQTWQHVNVYPVVPGFASIYRTGTLKHLKIEIPGLAIEDFNMAFQIHKKNLGIITYNPEMIAISEDPDNFRDYYKQVMRWNVGFFQTVKYWKIWPSRFWLSMGFFMLENFLIAVAAFLFPVLILAVSFYLLMGASLEDIFLNHFTGIILTGFGILFLADYLLTLFISFTSKNDMLSIYGLGFFVLHYINSIIFLVSIPVAFFTFSSGRWTSPKRLGTS